MRLIGAALLALLAAGCSSAPVIQVGSAREIPWNGIKVNVEMSQVPAGYRMKMSFWAAGFVLGSAVSPFEGSVLILKDGTIVPSESKAPEVLSFSGSSCNVDSEKIELFYAVPPAARLSRWVLRCGLGTLECEVEDWVALLMKEEPDRY